jgi:hypothetical protein
MSANGGSMWFVPTRRGDWEVWCATNTEEVFVGAWPTRGEAYDEARKYAHANGIHYKEVEGE